MITVGRLARKFGLSRSTLLYYDSIGLLRPAGRGGNGYRQYSDADVGRLAHICLYRRAGLSLEAIAGVLDGADDAFTLLLEQRLDELGAEIADLQNQQRIILALITGGQGGERGGEMTGDTWRKLFAGAGLEPRDMIAWHVNFERLAPAKHQVFLERLGLQQDEIADVRSWAAKTDILPSS